MKESKVLVPWLYILYNKEIRGHILLTVESFLASLVFYT